MINGGNIYVCSDKNLKMLKVIPMNLISRTFQIEKRKLRITLCTILKYVLKKVVYIII
jgi:hypothetical protein